MHVTCDISPCRQAHTSNFPDFDKWAFLGPDLINTHMWVHLSLVSVQLSEVTEGENS